MEPNVRQGFGGHPGSRETTRPKNQKNLVTCKTQVAFLAGGLLENLYDAWVDALHFILAILCVPDTVLNPSLMTQITTALSAEICVAH